MQGERIAMEKFGFVSKKHSKKTSENWHEKERHKALKDENPPQAF